MQWIGGTHAPIYRKNMTAHEIVTAWSDERAAHWILQADCNELQGWEISDLSSGCDPVLAALYYSKAACLQALQARPDFDPNKRHPWSGMPLLHAAVQRGSPQMLALFLQWPGLDINALDARGRNAMWHVRDMSDADARVKLLLAAGCRKRKPRTPQQPCAQRRRRL